MFNIKKRWSVINPQKNEKKRRKPKKNGKPKRDKLAPVINEGREKTATTDTSEHEEKDQGAVVMALETAKSSVAVTHPPAAKQTKLEQKWQEAVEQEDARSREKVVTLANASQRNVMTTTLGRESAKAEPNVDSLPCKDDGQETDEAGSDGSSVYVDTNTEIAVDSDSVSEGEDESEPQDDTKPFKSSSSSDEKVDLYAGVLEDENGNSESNGLTRPLRDPLIRTPASHNQLCQLNKVRTELFWEDIVTDGSCIDPTKGRQIPSGFVFTTRKPIECLQVIERYLISLKVSYDKWPDTACQLIPAEPFWLWRQLDLAYLQSLTWLNFVAFVVHTSEELRQISKLNEFVSIPRMVPVLLLPPPNKPYLNPNDETWSALRYVRYIIRCCENVSSEYLSNEGKWALIVSKTKQTYPEVYADEMMYVSKSLNDLYIHLENDSKKDPHRYRKAR